MSLLDSAISFILDTAQIPSFSSFEDRLHPYIKKHFRELPHQGQVSEIKIAGNSLAYCLDNNSERTIALTAHLDKINHFGTDYPNKLPVKQTDEYLEGAMDDCAGVGILLALASIAHKPSYPNLLFFFSEMEESKGFKEHPELLKNKGEGYEHGKGAREIAQSCIAKELVPDEVVTVDTTPLFKGKKGVALYARHWELNELEPSAILIEKTEDSISKFLSINNDIRVDNNTNDYQHYGFEFNKGSDKAVVSVALEPAIYPYHQEGERVFISDIDSVLAILKQYLLTTNS